MKRIMPIIIILGLFFWGVKAQALTSEAYMNMVGGVSGGYYYLYPKDIQLKDYYQGALSWKGFLAFKAENGLSALGEISMYSEGNRSASAPRGTTLRIIPITASMSYHFFRKSSLSPYIGGGIGIYAIDESDPDYNYLSTTKFGKHVFAGVDLHISTDTILRAELRQTFIDPVNSNLYYQANFGGLTASLALAIEWPLFRPAREMTPEERALEAQQKLAELKIQQESIRLQEMEFYYNKKVWSPSIHRRWKDRSILLHEIKQTKAQIEEEKARAEQLKIEQDKKREQYLEEKQKLRQEKKELSS